MIRKSVVFSIPEVKQIQTVVTLVTFSNIDLLSKANLNGAKILQPRWQWINKNEN